MTSRCFGLMETSQLTFDKPFKKKKNLFFLFGVTCCVRFCVHVCVISSVFVQNIIRTCKSFRVAKKIRNKRIRLTFYDVYLFRRVQSIRMEIIHVYQVPDKIILIRPCQTTYEVDNVHYVRMQLSGQVDPTIPA